MSYPRTNRRISTLPWLCLTASLLLVALIEARAQQPNNARGFNSESYKGDTIDYVNLFNGNLSLTIPIGQTYNAGGNLTYRLTLVYNSNVWDFRSSSFCDQLGQNCERIKAIPDPKTNAGMGWHLSLGRLYIKDTQESRDALGDDVHAHVYVSPDGAEHHFYTKLHQEDPLDPNYFYTNDSSYLRLHVLLNAYEIEFPDGEIHRFNSLGKITQMRDRWGNFLNITYALTQWVLTDTFGRTHTIFFTDQTQRAVSRVDLAAFNNTTATYDFIYQNESSGGTTTIPRHYNNTDPWTRPGETLNVAVPLLAEVSLPANAGSYRFTYYIGNELIGTENQPSGAIRSAVLPTLGEYEWTYGKYVFSGGPRQPPTEGNFGLVLNTSDGVKKKTVSANNDFGVYTYTQFSNIPLRDDVISFSTTTVRTPAQDETVYHFTATGTAWDYGLPYSPVASKNDGLSLSEEVYKGLVSDGNKVRSVYVRYEADPIIVAGYDYGDLRDGNTRLAARKTIYHDDGGTFSKTTYSNFDGLGHYRNEVTSGDFFPENSTTSRTTTMNYNASRGRYDFDPETGLPNTTGYQPFPISDPWLLNTYNESTMGENGATSRRQYCFDTGPNGKGFRRSERILLGSSPSALDVLILYSPRESGATSGRSLGELIREEYFGGDQGGAGSGTGCNSAPTQGASNQYQIDYDYQFGSLSSKSYAGTEIPFKLLDNDIDLNTGMPRVTRDSAGIGTTFTYDALGRATLEKPDAGHLACTSRSFQPASASVRRSVTEQRLANTSGTCGVVRTQNKVFYDGLNRPARSESLFPGGTSVQETTYNLLGWKLSESERMTGTPTRFTTYSNFDAFGRPGTITPADGAAHAVTMTYRGDREVTRQYSAGIDFDIEAPTFTTETYDHYGRLRKLGEGASDQAATLNYALPSNGGSVSSSPAFSANYPTSAVNDGDRTGFNWGRGGFGSGWNDNTQADYASDWVQISFGGARTIREVNVFTLRDSIGSTAPVTQTETFTTTDNSGNGIVDFDVEYLSGHGWKPLQCGSETVPCGRVIGNNKVWKQLILATPVSTIAIRVAVHKSVEFTNIPNNYSRIVEIEAVDTSNVNVARGILPATSGEINANYPASAVTDGDRTGFNWGKGGFGSGWNDNTQGVFANDWVQVDFNAEKQINEIDVFTLRRNFQDNLTPVQLTETFQDLTPNGQNVDNVGQGITYFNVQYWDSSASRWRTITCGTPTNPCGLVKNNNRVWKQLQFAPVTTSKIRVSVRDAVVYTTIPNNYSRIVEIEAYGPVTIQASQTLTTYSYDENNKMSGVSLAVPGLGSQSRSFSYDNRGFLQSETHPETGTTFYGTYDARGHARDERTGAAGGSFDLRTFYDRAERVTGIHYVFPTMTDPNNLRPLKLFTYDTGQTTTNFTKGKLVQAVRHNYIDRIAWDAIVTENYTYAGKGGAMSRRNTNVLHGPNSADANNFTQSFEYNDLGLVSKLTYPSVTAGDLLGKGPIRDVFYDYTNGYLMNLRNGTTSVASFNYHANGLTSTINYGNGVVWTQGNDPNSIPRVGSISATGILLPNGTAATYNLGQFSYDGKGNIKGMGTDRYAYDYLGRLKKGRLTALNGTGWSQEYSYDSFGNLTFIRTIDQNNIPTDRSIPVSASTNRLTNAGYDAAGNQTSSGSYTYGYDSLNMLQSFQDGVNGANQDVIYFYTPNDERIFTGNFKVNGDNSVKKITWSLRDLSGNVLREWIEQGTGSPLVWTFSWNKDYFNNGRRTLAEANSSPLPNGMIYYAHDHLGSVRATFNQDRFAIENHTYLPFAEEAILFTTSSTTPKSFTGHERDLNSSSTKDDDLIYMHARYYNPRFGRFLSPDPILNDLTNGSAGWSRYSYAGNNPIRNIDSTGNYREDFHYDLTNSLARAAGFSQQNAQAIAAATQGIDQHPLTNPFASFDAQWQFHFTTIERRDELFQAAMSEPLGRGNPQFFLNTGAYLHALQDSFSHAGFFAGIGHFLAGTSPDKTHKNPEKALRAAEASYNALVKLNLKNGGGYIVPWSTIREEVLAYLKAKEGTREKMQRLNELNEKIRESISQAKTP